MRGCARVRVSPRGVVWNGLVPLARHTTGRPHALAACQVDKILQAAQAIQDSLKVEKGSDLHRVLLPIQRAIKIQHQRNERRFSVLLGASPGAHLTWRHAR